MPQQYNAYDAFVIDGHCVFQKHWRTGAVAMESPLSRVPYSRFFRMAAGAVYKPSSVIVLDCDAAEYEEASNSNRMAMEAARSGDSATARSFSMGDRLSHVLAHEDFHRLQYLSTGYGFYLTELADAQARTIELFCNQLVGEVGKGITGLIPLYISIPESLSLLQLFASAPKYLVDVWQLYGDSVSAFSILDDAGTDLSEQSSHHVFHSIQLIDEARRWVEDLPSHSPLRTFKSLPGVAVSQIGGLDVVEGAAAVEGFLVAADSDFHPIQGLLHPESLLSQLKTKYAPEYWRTLDFFLSEIGSRDIWWRPLFYLCSHLALMSPLHPVYYCVFPDTAFGDLHPGLRFERAVRFTCAELPKLTELLSQRAFNKAANFICESLGWPNLLSLADALRGTTSQPDETAQSVHKQLVNRSAENLSMFIRTADHPILSFQQALEEVATFDKGFGPRVVVCRDIAFSTGDFKQVRRLIARDIRYAMAQSLAYNTTLDFQMPKKLAGTDLGALVESLIPEVGEYYFGIDTNWFRVQVFAE